MRRNRHEIWCLSFDDILSGFPINESRCASALPYVNVRNGRKRLSGLFAVYDDPALRCLAFTRRSNFPRLWKTRFSIRARYWQIAFELMPHWYRRSLVGSHETLERQTKEEGRDVEMWIFRTWNIDNRYRRWYALVYAGTEWNGPASIHMIYAEINQVSICVTWNYCSATPGDRSFF